MKSKEDFLSEKELNKTGKVAILQESVYFIVFIFALVIFSILRNEEISVFMTILLVYLVIAALLILFGNKIKTKVMNRGSKENEFQIDKMSIEDLKNRLKKLRYRLLDKENYTYAYRFASFNGVRFFEIVLITSYGFGLKEEEVNEFNDIMEKCLKEENGDKRIPIANLVVHTDYENIQLSEECKCKNVKDDGTLNVMYNKDAGILYYCKGIERVYRFKHCINGYMTINMVHELFS